MRWGTLLFVLLIILCASVIIVSTGSINVFLLESNVREVLMEPAYLILLGALHALTVAFVIPIAVLFLILGGYLFGFAFASVFFVLATCVGFFFMYAYASLFEEMSKKILGKHFDTLLSYAKENPWSYILSARFAPLVLFPVVHVIPTLAGISLKKQSIAFFISLVPQILVFTYVGATIGNASFNERFATDLSIGLAIISLFVLATTATRHYLKKRKMLRDLRGEK